MNKNILIVFLLIIIGVLGYFQFKSKNKIESLNQAIASKDTKIPEKINTNNPKVEISTYKNDKYKFTLSYPSKYIVSKDNNFSCMVLGKNNVGKMQSFIIKNGAELPIVVKPELSENSEAQFSGKIGYEISTDCANPNTLTNIYVAKKKLDFTTLDSYVTNQAKIIDAEFAGGATGGGASKQYETINNKTVTLVTASDGSVMGNTLNAYYWENGDYIYTISYIYSKYVIFEASPAEQQETYDQQKHDYQISKKIIEGFSFLN